MKQKRKNNENKLLSFVGVQSLQKKLLILSYHFVYPSCHCLKYDTIIANKTKLGTCKILPENVFVFKRNENDSKTCQKLKPNQFI